MGLYNMIFGVNPLSAILLRMLDLKHDKLNPNGEWPVGRFRDIELNADGTKIELYTRNGGGNREHWDFSYSEYEEGPDCPCPGCTIQYKIRKHPHYITDRDDDFDNTYAYVYFSVPEKYLELTQALATGEDPKTVSERFQAFIEALDNPKEGE